MKILLHADNTLPLAVQPICDLLNRICRTLKFSAGQSTLQISSPSVRMATTYKQFPKKFLDECRANDMSFICTALPYENNYFFESQNDQILISFHGWNLLTNLPVSNGFVYFIGSILCELRGIDNTHQENTGCVNDFWWDKRGVDVGMRAAFICGACRDRFKGSAAVLEDVDRILDIVSTASRAGRDVLAIGASSTKSAAAAFDVFLCHNSADKPAIRKINGAMKKAGLRTWLDEEQIKPGKAWQPELEQQIESVHSACVFVGGGSRSPWQSMELRGFLNEFVERECVVIPVLLPTASATPDLPIFLKQMMWVDLRTDYRKNLARLISSVSSRGR